jgi:hypothetical protein
MKKSKKFLYKVDIGITYPTDCSMFLTKTNLTKEYLIESPGWAILAYYINYPKKIDQNILEIIWEYNDKDMQYLK